MAIYLTVDGFKALSTLPSSFVDDVELEEPGWTANQLAIWSRWLEARLRKRYPTPFPAHDDTPPTPLTVQAWLARLVTVKVWLKRGVDPNDRQFDAVHDDHLAAKEEILEAANTAEGWFDLPARDDEDASAIRGSSPRGYSEQSPYVWTDQQGATARAEDRLGRGSGG